MNNKKIFILLLFCAFVMGIAGDTCQKRNTSFCPCEELCLDSLKCTFSLDLDYFNVSVESTPSVFWSLNQNFDLFLEKENAKEVILQLEVYNQKAKLDSIICKNCNSNEKNLILNSFKASELTLITPNQKFIDQKFRTYLRFFINTKSTD